MKKRIFIILVLLSVASICFAKTAKYRYAFVTEKAVLIADWKEKLSDEQLNNPQKVIIPMNTKQERFTAEAAFKKVQSYFYSDIPFIYADYTKNEKDPDMLYIDSWSDVIAYVRDTK